MNIAPVFSPNKIVTLPYNNITPSAVYATAPAPSASAITVSWTNNLNAAPTYNTQIVAQERNPKGATTAYTLNAYDVSAKVSAAYSTGVRPESQVVTAPLGSFPSLTAVAGDFRMVAIWSNQGRALIQNLLRWDN